MGGNHVELVPGQHVTIETNGFPLITVVADLGPEFEFLTPNFQRVAFEIEDIQKAIQSQRRKLDVHLSQGFHLSKKYSDITMSFSGQAGGIIVVQKENICSEPIQSRCDYSLVLELDNIRSFQLASLNADDRLPPVAQTCAFLERSSCEYDQIIYGSIGGEDKLRDCSPPKKATESEETKVEECWKAHLGQPGSICVG